MPDWSLEKWIAAAGFAITVAGFVAGGVAWLIDQTSAGMAARRPVCGMSTTAEPDLLVGGYVVIDTPEAAKTRPSVARACNSRDADNRVTRRGPGRYDVRLENLGVDGGTVEVTAVSDGARVCGTDGWGMAENGKDLDARVVCSDQRGTPRDSGFTLRFLQARAGTGALAYLRYDAGSASPFVPDPNYSFNSFSSSVSVEREAVGEYEIFLEDIQQSVDNGAPGVVKVTSLGPVPRVCNPRMWNSWRNKETGKRFLMAKVHCTDAAGVAVDTGFTATYTVELASRPDLRVPGAQLWADDEHAPRYTPMMSYQYNSTGHDIMVQRTGPGSYRVELAGFSASRGQAQVSGYGGSAYCAVAHSVEQLGDSTTVGVRCWRNGRPADARFVLLHQP
ncbi:hypothetical protein [Couchioplanes azureus]|uniref:hypothetical protein n=1 Tax=Couchioplanes caeruleus TaxID=56438 RepID=UPI00166FFDF6|nr:hypothetical protein [Couchioplanes caeruleus]GGQ67886.1 hypothetical protein GCM10010166_42340 [Couchioplanes caeruleus subsp. azureus]